MPASVFCVLRWRVVEDSRPGTKFGIDGDADLSVMRGNRARFVYSDEHLITANHICLPCDIRPVIRLKKNHGMCPVTMCVEGVSSVLRPTFEQHTSLKTAPGFSRSIGLNLAGLQTRSATHRYAGVNLAGLRARIKQI